MTYMLLGSEIFLTHDLEIATDFVTMHPTVRVHDLGREVLHIDFGGAVFTEEKPLVMEVRERKFSFYTHQYLTLLHGLNVALENPQPGGFVQVSAWIHEILIDEEVARALKESILEAEASLKVLEQDYLEKWDRAMAALGKSGTFLVDPKKADA